MVEKGRHFSPKLPLSERICKLCNLHEVEDEFHFVMKCTKYNFQRDQLFKELSEIYNLDSLSNEDIFFYILCVLLNMMFLNQYLLLLIHVLLHVTVVTLLLYR